MLAFARVALIRLGRDRSNVFFVVLFPLLLVMLLGAQFGGQLSAVVGLVAAPSGYADDVRARLEAADEVTVLLLEDRAAADRAIEDGAVDAVLLLDEVAEGGLPVPRWIAPPSTASVVARSVVLDVVGEAAVLPHVGAAITALPQGPSLDEAMEMVARADVAPPSVSVTTVSTTVNGPDPSGTLGPFDRGASTQLLLFVFITALTGSASVVQARRRGVLQRALAGPTSPMQVIGGLALGQLVVLLTQSVIIVAGTAALFGVDWGDPLAGLLVIVAFAMVGATASLLLGSLVRTDEQAGGLGVPLGLGLAALGGSMVPIELFPDALVSVSRFTPHAWGNAAFDSILRDDAGVSAVVTEVGVLLAFALVLGALAAARLRAAIAAG